MILTSFIKPITPVGLMLLVALLISGCQTSRLTEPVRTASELLLLSHSADHALEKMDLGLLAGHKVFLETVFFQSVDQEYVIGAIREKIGQQNAILVNSGEDAEFIVEVRNRGFGMDIRSSLFGLPSMEIPIPFAGKITSPELAIFKTDKADAIASFVLAVYHKTEGLELVESEPLNAKAKLDQYQLLWLIKWRDTDIPELGSSISFLQQKLGHGKQ